MAGIDLIREERVRQVTQEGWTPEHDEQHEDGELALAACCYASPEPLFIQRRPNHFDDPWPDWWDYQWDKRQRDEDEELIPNEQLPTAQRIRNLVKAGALIAAEIDRLDRERFNDALEKAQQHPKGSFLNP